MTAAATHPLFLGVARSVQGRAWRDRLDAAGRARAEQLVQTEALPDILARLLAARGVEPAEAGRFLEPRLRDLLPDPAVLTGMLPAAERLADAAQRGERVAVFGDYDVDGACASALLAGFLREAGAAPRIYIPDRLIEGYGPNSEAIRLLAGEGARLIVTVDCGTTSHEPLAEATLLGLDTVVLDHHQAPEALPAVTALVNPNRHDDLSGLGHLCAAGVVFLTLVAVNRVLRQRGHWARRPGGEPDLLAALDLVALATVADVVPLKGLNRAFVRQGLAILRARTRPGLAALADVAGLDGPMQPWHLGFLLGPRINAGGRIGDAGLGARLLLEQDETQARAIAAELNRLNQERQEIERQAVAEAVAMADLALLRDPALPVLLCAAPGWHPGIVGLVAARLKERFRRPAFALALHEAGATGSGRSVAGVDLGKAVRAAVEAGLAVKGGGHAMAAGVTLAPGQQEAFHAFLIAALTADVAKADEAASLAVDAALSAGGASPRLLAEIERAGPFGAGSAEPVFVFPAHRLAEAVEVGTGGHVRIRLRGGDGATIGGIAFRAAQEPLGQALLAARGEAVHLAATLSLNRWGGRETVELRVIDVAKPV